jgi:hypothetical protein
MAPFGYADKPAEKYYWLICCKRKILFRLKNKLKSTDYKLDELNVWLIYTSRIQNAPELQETGQV